MTPLSVQISIFTSECWINMPRYPFNKEQSFLLHSRHLLGAECCLQFLPQAPLQEVGWTLIWVNLRVEERGCLQKQDCLWTQGTLVV